MLMKPLRISFGVNRTMPYPSPGAETALEAYACVCSKVCMRDLVEEFVAFGVDPLRKKIQTLKVPKG